MTRYHKRFTVVFVSNVMGVAVGSYAKDFHLKSQAQEYLNRIKYFSPSIYVNINGYVRTNGKERRV